MADKKKEILKHVDEDRREFVQRVLATMAFAAPIGLGLTAIQTRDVQAQAESGSESAGSSESNESNESNNVSVPEPSTIALLGLGLAGAALARQAAKQKEDDTEL